MSADNLPFDPDKMPLYNPSSDAVARMKARIDAEHKDVGDKFTEPFKESGVRATALSNEEKDNALAKEIKTQDLEYQQAHPVAAHFSRHWWQYAVAAGAVATLKTCGAF